MAQGQGITSLMPGQAPAPGQSAQPMPGMQPPMGGPSAGVVDLVGPLKNLPEQVLTMELMNPQSKLEKYAVLAALDQKNRERKTMQAVQGMMAQQQNAQMQGQGTVAQQVAQEAQAAEEPVMAALGGLMRSYAGGGGVVAFSNGASEKGLPYAAEPSSAQSYAVEDFPGYQNPDVDENGNPRSVSERAAIVDANRRNKEAYARYRAAQARAAAPAPRPLTSLSTSQGIPIEAIRRMQEFPPVGPRGGETPEDRQRLQAQLAATPVPAPVEDARRRGDIPPEGIVAALPSRDVPPPVVPASREGAAKTRPAPPPAPAPAPAPVPVTTGIPAALQAQFDEQRAALKGQLQKPAELTKKEAGLDALMQQRIREEEARSAEPTSEALKALQEALRRRGEFDAGDWFRLAGSIDPRRGYAFKSMGEGLAGIMERKAQSAEAARKELVAAQREQRQLQSKVSELRILAQQEQVLRERGEFDRANALRDKMFGLEKDIFALQRDIEEKERDYGLKQRQVAAQEKTARAAEISAGRPTDFDKKLKLLKDDPATYRRMYGDEEAEKMLRLRAQLLKDYSANMNTLQLQGINSFEDYAALMGPSLMGASAGVSVPPAGAVREKGK